MNQKALLAEARKEFINSFDLAIHKTIPQCIEILFVKANESFSSLEQNRLLDARTTLVDQGKQIHHLMRNNLDKLLERSVHTSYSSYRPSIDLETSELTLIDPFAFEGDLKLEEITNRFRAESAEQLRDLNIRIALLFEQDATNERENPFRPYLFSKCISLTFEELNLSQEVTSLLLVIFAENFIGQVQTIYRDLNNFLAEQGLAAQLQLKIKKAPTKKQNTGTALDRNGENTAARMEQSQQEQLGQQEQQGYQAQQSQQGQHGQSEQYLQNNASYPQKDTPRATSPIEQFFSGALRRAANLVGMGGNHSASGEQSSSTSTAQGSMMSSASYQGDQHYGQQGQQNYQSGHSGQSSQNQNQYVDQAKQSNQASFSWLQEGESVGEVLRDFFSESSNAQLSSMGAPSYENAGAKQSNASTTLSRSVQTIQRAHTPSGSEMINGSGEVRNLILEQRNALGEATSNVQEKMTIDVVAMLFEYILRDNQVPAEVRAQLGRLQFLLLKIALKDNSLLTQKSHPARLLVNRIGSISLSIKQTEPSGVLITNEICRIVEVLLNDETENIDLFTQLLDDFDGFITKELRVESQKTESAIAGVEKARNRTLRFAHATEKLREALNGLTIDPVLRDFFENAWIFVVELADGEDKNRAYRYRLMVPDLLWSIIPKVREEERLQLLALLPIMLGTLKEGLESIKWDEELKAELMNWLVNAHTKSLRLSPAATLEAYPSLSTVHNHFNNFFKDVDPANFAILKNQSSSEIRQFLDDAIKDLDLKVQLLDQICEEELPSNDTKIMEDRSGDADFILERLRTGIAVELRLGGEPTEGRLNWIDPALTSLILTLDGQEEPSMVSVRMFRRMIAHGRVRFVEAEPLFERAVQSLLKSADSVNAENNAVEMAME